MEFLNNLSNLMYSWILNPRLDGYREVFQNIHGGGYGMRYSLIVLLVVALLFVLLFYFGISTHADAANKKNYMMTIILGGITLLVATVVVLAFLTDKSLMFNLNLLYLLLIDIVYFIILYEVFSLIFKGMSKNARNIDMFSLFRN